MKRFICAAVAWACLALPALATSVGPTIAGTGADNSGAGTQTWTNPGNVTANDSNYATVALNAFNNNPLFSHYLKATNFGFSIPSGATINGIQVDINKDTTVGSGSVQDGAVKLVDGSGTVVGNDKGDTTTNWSSGSFTTATYGSSSDMWGTSLTYSDINNSNFGVVMQAQQKTNFTNSTAQVNYIQITVTYTAAGGGTASQSLMMMGVGI